MNIWWGVLGFCGIKIHIAALETPAWSQSCIHCSCLSLSAHHSCSTEHRGHCIPQGSRNPAHISFQQFFLVLNRNTAFCISGVSPYSVGGLRWGMWGLFYINRRGEGSCKSHLRLLPAAPRDQQSCWEVQGCWRSRKAQEWEVQAGRDRILGGFSPSRSSKNKIHELSSRTPSGMLEGCVGAGCCTLSSVCFQQQPFKSAKICSKHWWLQPGFLQSNLPVSKCMGD